jgi:succinyl-CoA:acetate CoA-transferase
VPFVPHVNHTEHDIDLVVTKQGTADVRGMWPDERAEVIIKQCAHPDYRNRLLEYVTAGQASGGHVPHEINDAFKWLRNR